MWARVDDRRPFTAALIGLIVLAWLVLLAWGQSPYERFLSHEQLGEVKTGLSGDTALVALAFVGGWLSSWCSATSAYGPCSASWPTPATSACPRPSNEATGWETTPG